MNAIDLLFLLVGVAALAAWLLLDKVARVIVWECLRHPFTRSRIEVRDGKVYVSHPPSGAAKQADQLSGAN